MIEFIRNRIEAILSIALLLAVVCSSLGMFFYKFDGEVSNVHGNWGDFGSFISGTIGVAAACLAVIWLIFSVHLQKQELAKLKSELKRSSKEQEKQTSISALSALINTCHQKISAYHSDVLARKDGVDLDFCATETDLRMQIDDELRKIVFYGVQLESYLDNKYVDPYSKKKKQDDDDLPF